MIHTLTVQLVGHADRDFVEIAQHVEVGHRHLRRALHLAAVAGRHAVKPAHAARTAGGRAVFAAVAAALAQLLGLIAEQLRRERARAHAGGIRLRDRDDLFDAPDRNARAHRAVAGQRRGGRDHRVNTVIRVAERAELALQQDLLALANRLHHVSVGIRHIRADALGKLGQLDDQRLQIDRLPVIEVDDHRVLDIQRVGELLAQHVRIIQLAELQADLLEFVAVERRNARFG